MRIAMIAPTPFFADRGCHVRILGEAKALQELGHEVKICTYHLGKDVEGIEAIRTPPMPWYKKLSAGPSLHKFYNDLFLLGKVLQTCWSFRPHVIHAHLHEGIVLGKIASALFRTPLVADLQGSLTEELLDHRFIPRWPWLLQTTRWLEKRINQMPESLIASSTQTAQQVVEHFGFAKHAVSAIGDGVDLDIFYPRAADPTLQATLGISQHDKVVVFIGVLTPYQGIDLLLEAIPYVIQEIQNVKFLIIGFPEEGYRKKATALGIEKQAIFTGKIPYAEAPRYLALGDVAISPKMSTTEANLKLYTYMAMGLPAVVFDNPVNREILEDLGVYATYGDMHSLTLTLISILQDEKRAKKLGEESYRKAVSDYSWRSVGCKLLQLYQQFDRKDSRDSAEEE